MERQRNISDLVDEMEQTAQHNELKFLTGICAKIKNQSQAFDDKEIYQIFDDLDTKEEGKIEFNKAIHFLLVFRSDLNKFQLDDVINHFLSNKSEEITRDEFVERMKFGKKISDKKDRSEIEEVFNLLDSDHDGVLGRSDIQMAMNLLGEDFFDEVQSKNLIDLLKESKIVGARGEGGISKTQFIDLFQNEP